MAQAKNGLIYVANHGGVLEFDGVSWRVIHLPDLTLRSLAIDSKGTVYMGGHNGIWYLAPDDTGSLKYVSLLDQIKEEHRNFGTVWSTHATKEGIFFRTLKFLFRWDYKKMAAWETADLFKASFVYNGELIVQEGERGLFRIVKDSLQPMPGGERFSGAKIAVAIPFANDDDTQKILIGNRSNEFFLYDGKRSDRFPIGPEVANHLKENKLFHGTRLFSGDFAIATRGGLLIMDRSGKLKTIFDRTYGLQDDNVKHAFRDIYGNLWLCLEKGISKIEYASPISIHDERSNLSGLVLSVVEHNSDLYVGDTNGLHYLESPLKFRTIPGIPGSCSSLISIRGSIFAATTAGIFQVEQNIKRKITSHPAYVLQPSQYYPNRIWCGTLTGLMTLSRNNSQWKEGQLIKGIDQKIVSIAEDKNGNVWLGTLTGNVLKVDFSAHSNIPPVTRYDHSHGLPDKEIYAAGTDERVIFATAKGLFRFDEKKEGFIPDLTLGNEFAGGLMPVFRIRVDKNTWFHSESRNYQAIPLQDGTFKIDGIPFLRIPTTAQVNAIYSDPDGKAIWFASHNGLIRYDTTIPKDYRQQFQTLIRKVLVNEKQVNEKQIFDGYKKDRGQAGKVIFPAMVYRDRNIYFEFAAPFFEAETETHYRYFLEGYDSAWSTWDKETKKYYTNLDSGSYTFRVQAKNIYEHRGNEDAFRFRILPPWYKTWWSFVIYALLILGVMFLVIKLRSGRLEQEKQRLEGLVKERTKEVYEKNQLLEEQSEKLKEMDRVKSRFFANISHEFRTPLTLIMGPIEQMLSNNKDKSQQKKLTLMLSSSQRLLTLINQLLDLAQLDSGRMKLKASLQDIVSFVRGISASFQNLALQKQLSLEFYSQEEAIFIYFDPGKIEEVMYNLLINSVKFTPPGGKVTVSIFERKGEPTKEKDQLDDYIEISVQDTGIGMSPDQMLHIFDRFYQAENPNGTHLKGTGIGLALTKEIVLLHHGTID
ncbi:MAG: hypothetical protein GY940_33185, partial [bacterium]|nr:hypothetical protein [bacterium]